MEWSLVKKVILPQGEANKLTAYQDILWQGGGWKSFILTPLTEAGHDFSSVSFDKYAMFAAGMRNGDGFYGITAYDEVYDNTLTKVQSTRRLRNNTFEMSTLASSDYAFKSGGANEYSGSAISFSKAVDLYDKNLTISAATDLYEAKCTHVGIYINGYALFAGGRRNGGGLKSVDAYDADLVHTYPKDLDTGRYYTYAALVMRPEGSGGFAVIIGGKTTRLYESKKVDAYNVALTRYAVAPDFITECSRVLGSNRPYAFFSKTTVMVVGQQVCSMDYNLTTTLGGTLNQQVECLNGENVDGLAWFVGFADAASDDKGMLVTIDYNMTITYKALLSSHRHHVAAARAGNSAIFAGGYGTDDHDETKVVEAITWA